MADALDARALRRRYDRARQARAAWEPLWQECYDYALPPRSAFTAHGGPAERADRLFDGTAADAVDQLAASLLARLTPPWSRWFGLAPGLDLAEDEQRLVAPVLERAADALQAHFDRSNFAVEIHQCYLDLVTVGTACLLFEEAPPGAPSAFRFTAVPLAEACLEEGPDGRLDIAFRRTELTVEAFRARFPKAPLDDALARRAAEGETVRLAVLEAVLPSEDETGRYRYRAVRAPDAPDTAVFGAGRDDDRPLAEGEFDHPPFLAFRWMKAPGESYGRSPVMKALPDIKTADKVVELILKNASIAATGIWQAEDDGVINPANIRLVPGSIIPKAVGSAGLTPLEAPGRFDVSQLVLEDLRKRIRHALLADALGPVDAPRMTATEVVERAAEMARLLGATYGRLQSELLTPLVHRGLAILGRRREVPDVIVDGRTVVLQYRSPLAQDQAKNDVRNVSTWLDLARGLGPEGLAAVDAGGAARWMARTLGVPSALVKAPGATAPGAVVPGENAAGDPLAAVAAKLTPETLADAARRLGGLFAGGASTRANPVAPLPIPTPPASAGEIS
jgi:hypothetical protein